MFVQRKRSIRSKFDRFRCPISSIAFLCTGRMPGFTIGKLYKPFAYSFDSDSYKDFCIFDDFGKVMFMERNLIHNNIFNIIFTDKHHYEFALEDDKRNIDIENKRYSYIDKEEE